MSLLPLPTEQAVDILGQFARVTDHWSPKVDLDPGQCCVVPRGVDHHPVAAENAGSS